MSENRPQAYASPATRPEEPDGVDRTGVPEPSRIEAWIRTLTGFEDARVVGVEPLTDGLSNMTCRLNVADGPVAAAVLRIQPRRGIFEPYDVLREGRVLSHLAGTVVPVPRLLAAESDPRFFGSPFLLLESIRSLALPLGHREQHHGGADARYGDDDLGEGRPQHAGVVAGAEDEVGLGVHSLIQGE